MANEEETGWEKTKRYTKATADFLGDDFNLGEGVDRGLTGAALAALGMAAKKDFLQPHLQRQHEKSQLEKTKGEADKRIAEADKKRVAGQQARLQSLQSADPDATAAFLMDRGTTAGQMADMPASDYTSMWGDLSSFISQEGQLGGQEALLGITTTALQAEKSGFVSTPKPENWDDLSHSDQLNWISAETLRTEVHVAEQVKKVGNVDRFNTRINTINEHLLKNPSTAPEHILTLRNALNDTVATGGITESQRITIVERLNTMEAQADNDTTIKGYAENRSRQNFIHMDDDDYNAELDTGIGQSMALGSASEKNFSMLQTARRGHTTLKAYSEVDIKPDESWDDWVARKREEGTIGASLTQLANLDSSKIEHERKTLLTETSEKEVRDAYQTGITAIQTRGGVSAELFTGALGGKDGVPLRDKTIQLDDGTIYVAQVPDTGKIKTNLQSAIAIKKYGSMSVKEVEAFAESVKLNATELDFDQNDINGLLAPLVGANGIVNQKLNKAVSGVSLGQPINDMRSSYIEAGDQDADGIKAAAIMAEDVRSATQEGKLGGRPMDMTGLWGAINRSGDRGFFSDLSSPLAPHIVDQLRRNEENYALTALAQGHGYGPAHMGFTDLYKGAQKVHGVGTIGARRAALKVFREAAPKTFESFIRNKEINLTPEEFDEALSTIGGEVESIIPDLVKDIDLNGLEAREKYLRTEILPKLKKLGDEGSVENATMELENIEVLRLEQTHVGKLETGLRQLLEFVQPQHILGGTDEDTIFDIKDKDGGVNFARDLIGAVSMFTMGESKVPLKGLENLHGPRMTLHRQLLALSKYFTANTSILLGQGTASGNKLDVKARTNLANRIPTVLTDMLTRIDNYKENADLMAMKHLELSRRGYNLPDGFDNLDEASRATALYIADEMSRLKE